MGAFPWWLGVLPVSRCNHAIVIELCTRRAGIALALVASMRTRRIIPVFVIITMAGGCAVDSSPCGEAAKELAGCSEDQRQAFVAACETTGGGDPQALLGDDASAACAAPPSDGKADLQTSAAAGMCIAAMYGVKWGVTALSPAGEPLSAEDKAMLRPLYGGLVDEVRVTIGAALPPRVVIAGHELAVKPDAMTFGDHVFILQAVADDTKSFQRLLLTTTHELAHAQQAHRAGSYFAFATAYCRDMIAANFAYDQIQLEQDAYAIQGRARSSLQSCGRVTCP